jgi:hypothetical protein
MGLGSEGTGGVVEQCPLIGIHPVRDAAPSSVLHDLFLKYIYYQINVRSGGPTLAQLPELMFTLATALR